jgi:hypothetical protein
MADPKTSGCYRASFPRSLHFHFSSSLYCLSCHNHSHHHSCIIGTPIKFRKCQRIHAAITIITGVFVLIGLRATGTWCLGTTTPLFPSAHAFSIHFYGLLRLSWVSSLRKVPFVDMPMHVFRSLQVSLLLSLSLVGSHSRGSHSRLSSGTGSRCSYSKFLIWCRGRLCRFSHKEKMLPSRRKKLHLVLKRRHA